MSQDNELNENEGGSNVVGTGAVDTNPTGKDAKLGDSIRRRMAEEMAAKVKTTAQRVYKVTSKK